MRFCKIAFQTSPEISGCYTSYLGLRVRVHVVLFWCRGRLPKEGPEERDAHGGTHQGTVGVGRPGGGRLPGRVRIAVTHYISLVFAFQNSKHKFESIRLNHVLHETLNPIDQPVFNGHNGCLRKFLDFVQQTS